MSKGPLANGSWYGSAVIFLVVYISTLILNAGFMGTDEYWTGITRYVPAQEKNYENMLHVDDVKSPTQMMPLVWTSHRALDFGFSEPYDQYRFVQITLGLICILIMLWCLLRFSEDEDKTWLFLTFTFYGAAPFAFTRPMYESLSAPFVFLSALSLREYLKDKASLKWIFVSTLAISAAFALRPQTGIAALAIPFFLILRKDYKALAVATGIGLLCFLILGLPDYFLRRSFHYSLKAILFYNVQYGASYAQQPWYFYVLLCIVLLWIPFWISKSFPQVLRKSFNSQKFFWVYIILILGLHSFFPQKWERFVIPVLPLMVWIVANWVRGFWENGSRVRIAALLSLNLLLWIPASFFPAQQNIIEVSLYLDRNPDIKTLYRLNRNPEWITEAFIRRKDWNWMDVQALPNSLECTSRLIMNQTDYEKVGRQSSFELERVFQTNAVEKAAYQMNPTKNVRRTPLYLLKKQGC